METATPALDWLNALSDSTTYSHPVEHIEIIHTHLSVVALTGEFAYNDIARLAQRARGDDPFGYRGEFLGLVNLAQSISQPEQHVQVGR